MIKSLLQFRRNSNQKRKPSNQKRDQVKSKTTAKKDSVNEAPKKKISKPKKDNKPAAKKDSEAKLQADAAVGKVNETKKESKSEQRVECALLQIAKEPSRRGQHQKDQKEDRQRYEPIQLEIDGFETRDCATRGRFQEWAGLSGV